MVRCSVELVSSQVNGVTVDQMRNGKLQLSQPGVGGWHFFADDNDPKIADALVSAWASGFCQSSSYGSDCSHLQVDWSRISLSMPIRHKTFQPNDCLA